MKGLERLFLWWQSGKTRRKMERVFGRGEDPYGYRGSPYERARLAAMEESLGDLKDADILEIGCAEGAFTERLKDRAKTLAAVDISGVALSRARRRLSGAAVDFFEGDIREWAPPGGARYDLIVLGDVLYYLDKPLVRELFEETFRRVRSWLKPGGRIILAHGFAGPVERAHRQGFRERFERLGLKLSSERVVGSGLSAGPVSCLLSVMESDDRA